MPGLIAYKNLLRTLDPSTEHGGWSDTERLTDEDPRLCATATGSSGVVYELIYDLGIARTGTAVGLVNHNLANVSGMTWFYVKTGSTDNGTTWDETRLTVGNLLTCPDYTPSFVGMFSSSVSKRYWRFEFATSTSATDVLSVGQLALFNADADLPLAPCSPLEVRGQDTTILGRGLWGYETRHDAGIGSQVRRIRWKMTPGNVSVSTQVRDILRYARKHSAWGFHPVCWVPYGAERPNPSYEAYPCAYCLMDRVADAEVLTVGTVRRYDVSLHLRELTFHGLY